MNSKCAVALSIDQYQKKWKIWKIPDFSRCPYFSRENDILWNFGKNFLIVTQHIELMFYEVKKCHVLSLLCKKTKAGICWREKLRLTLLISLIKIKKIVRKHGQLLAFAVTKYIFCDIILFLLWQIAHCPFSNKTPLLINAVLEQSKVIL